MSDEPTIDGDDYEQYQGPLDRFKKAARPIFGLWALFGVAAVVVSFCGVVGVIAWGFWREMSRADWSFWTWPRVLIALLGLLGIAILIRNRIRGAGTRSDR